MANSELMCLLVSLTEDGLLVRLTEDEEFTLQDKELIENFIHDNLSPEEDQDLTKGFRIEVFVSEEEYEQLFNSSAQLI